MSKYPRLKNCFINFPIIRHPEELSLCKPLDPEHLRMNYQVCQVLIMIMLIYEVNEYEEGAILASGESLQMRRGSCMRSHMKEGEMRMDEGITLKSRRV